MRGLTRRLSLRAFRPTNLLFAGGFFGCELGSSRGERFGAFCAHKGFKDVDHGLLLQRHAASGKKLKHAAQIVAASFLQQHEQAARGVEHQLEL